MPTLFNHESHCLLRFAFLLACLVLATPTLGQDFCGNGDGESTLELSQLVALPSPIGCTVPDDGAVVDLLLIYTADGRASVETLLGDDIAVVMPVQVANVNQVLANSLIDTRWNLVGLSQTSYVESGDMYIDMPRLNDPSDGFMDDAQYLAAVLNADVIGLIVKDCGTGPCGLGGATSFIVAGDRVGIITHESGHVLSGAHCAAYKFPTGTTKMDSPTANCAGGPGPGGETPHYSNPDVLVLGEPTGDATHNNAQRMNDASFATANIRPARDCNCNGIIDSKDISNGTSNDNNANGSPDECDCTMDSDCDDGIFCNGIETCDLATEICIRSPCPDDRNPCTVCVEAVQDCAVPDDSVCDDGLFCDGQETCGPTSCLSAPDPCSVNDTCDEVNDLCIAPFCGDSTCDPNEDCDNCPSDCLSSGASCGNGVCEAGDGEDCISCNSDCNGKQGGKPADRFCCGDGDGVNPVGCSDPNCGGPSACIDQPAMNSCCGDGTCEGVEDVANCLVDCGCSVSADCDDGIVCTLDNCLAGICNHQPSNTFCPSDGIFCNGFEFCDGSIGCASTGDPCSGGLICNEATNACDPECTADANCDDGQFCNGFETCVSGGATCSQDSDCCSGNCKGNGSCK